MQFGSKTYFMEWDPIRGRWVNTYELGYCLNHFREVMASIDAASSRGWKAVDQLKNLLKVEPCRESYFSTWKGLVK